MRWNAYEFTKIKPTISVVLYDEFSDKWNLNSDVPMSCQWYFKTENLLLVIMLFYTYAWVIAFEKKKLSCDVL